MTKFFLGAAAGGIAWYLWQQNQSGQAVDSTESWWNDVTDQIAENVDPYIESGNEDIQFMQTSNMMKSMLKRREGLKLSRYRLGDGGWTLGYGRYFPDGGTVPPAAIDLATAEAWFDEDLVAKGEKWVKLYIKVSLQQNQFDALASMAYNLKPSSFKKIADAVNRGEDPEPVAMVFTRPGTNLEDGLINRRKHEMAVFNYGIYA